MGLKSLNPQLPILATAVTPWTSHYDFDEEAFRRQLRAIARGLTRDIYIFGTAGEGYAVSDQQFREIATCFWQTSAEENILPMLGIISLSLQTMIERIEWGRALGFRDFQLSLPSWGALNDEELAIFFTETCGRFSDCRFLHYNLARTKRVLTAADYRRLCAAHPNLEAIKMGVSDPIIIRELMELRPRLQIYFTESGYIEARRLGDCGFLISLASVNYAMAKAIVAGTDAERLEALPSIQAMGKALTEISVGHYHIDGAFDKILYRINDGSFPLRMLPPYIGATEENARAFREALPVKWRTSELE